jgi:hypothetical protein
LVGDGYETTAWHLTAEANCDKCRRLQRHLRLFARHLGLETHAGLDTFGHRRARRDDFCPVFAWD